MIYISIINNFSTNLFINNFKTTNKMKKIYLFIAAAMMSTALFAQLQVATFEDVTLPGEESVLHLDSTGYFNSGNYYFVQEVQDWGDYGVYYFGNIVSNKSDNIYASYLDAEKSASGGAYEGDNFLVWTQSYYGYDMIMLPVRSVVPGMYVNNTAWVVDAILHGDGMSVEGDTVGLPFGEDDFFTLYIGGLQRVTADSAAVVSAIAVDLARGTNYIQDWTYVDLSQLGQVDAVKFALTSSKQNASGMTTPAYFCIDNFGAADPNEAIENTKADQKAVKEIRNGQVVIIRGEKAFNILGTEL